MKISAQVLDFHTIVTLNEVQGHSNWYQNVDSVVSIIIPNLKDFFSELIVRAFLPVLQFPALLHRLMISVNKIKLK